MSKGSSNDSESEQSPAADMPVEEVEVSSESCGEEAADAPGLFWLNLTPCSCQR